MPQQCVLCEKIANNAWRRVKLRGKYNPTVKHLQKPNLQWVVLPLTWKSKGISANTIKTFSLIAGKRIKACAKCKKALGKDR